MYVTTTHEHSTMLSLKMKGYLSCVRKKRRVALLYNDRELLFLWDTEENYVANFSISTALSHD
jgi:hypothetical protein